MLDLGVLENKGDLCYASHTSHGVEHTFRRHFDRGFLTLLFNSVLSRFLHCINCKYSSLFNCKYRVLSS